jgi:hypothetical protein
MQRALAVIRCHRHESQRTHHPTQSADRGAQPVPDLSDSRTPIPTHEATNDDQHPPHRGRRHAPRGDRLARRGHARRRDRVYSSIAHPSADYLVDQGAQRAATVYDHWGTSCTASGCTNIPSRADFLDQVADAVSSFRTDDVLILDFESLVLYENGTDTAAAQNSADQLLIFIS